MVLKPEALSHDVEWHECDAVDSMLRIHRGVLKTYGRWYITAYSTEPHQRITDVEAASREVALYSLCDVIEHEWRAEVPSDAFDFVCGGGISNAATMFYNPRARCSG